MEMFCVKLLVMFVTDDNYNILPYKYILSVIITLFAAVYFQKKKKNVNS